MRTLSPCLGDPLAVYSGKQWHRAARGRNQVSSTDTRCRVYDPEAINTMAWAFDKAYEGLSEQSKRQPKMRQELALCIMRLFDEGERRPLRLSRMALTIATIVTGSDGQRVSNRAIARSNTIGVPFPSGTDGRPETA
jgi:hypothetical protein